MSIISHFLQIAIKILSDRLVKGSQALPGWLLQPCLPVFSDTTLCPNMPKHLQFSKYPVALMLLVCTLPLSGTPLYFFKNPSLTLCPKKMASQGVLCYIHSQCCWLTVGEGRELLAFCPGCWRRPWQCPYPDVSENRQCWEIQGCGADSEWLQKRWGHQEKA